MELFIFHPHSIFSIFRLLVRIKLESIGAREIYLIQGVGLGGHRVKVKLKVGLCIFLMPCCGAMSNRWNFLMDGMVTR